jgi:cytochrome b6-f complex iron-sulfur subunit
MATASAAKEAKPTAKATAQVQVSAPSRREFLYYIWGASFALLLGETTAGLLWFIFPRFKEGEFGGTFNFTGDEVPAPNDPPNSKPAGRFHIVNSPGEGLVVLYAVCTHLGCLPKWVQTNFRFECPCHGSKYQLDGTYIEGPAPRSLDRFFTRITFADGTTAESNANGDPIPVEGKTVASISINTGARILRAGRV